MHTQYVELAASLRAIGKAWHPKAGEAYNELRRDADALMRYKQNLFFLLKRPGIGPDDPSEIWQALEKKTSLSGGAIEQVRHGIINLHHAGYIAECLGSDAMQMFTENFWENPFFQERQLIA